MNQRIINSIISFFGLVLASASITVAQSPNSTEVLSLNSTNSWQGAQSIGSSKGKVLRKLFVVTLEEPSRRQACRVQSFDLDKLVCSRALGGPRTFLSQQVAALIVPGDGRSKLWLMLGFNGGLGAAIWGTVMLTAACPACAVATGIAAYFCFGAAVAILIGDDQPDRLLYLAPGQQLSRKLGDVHS
jgi:hypothetical protein